MSSERPTATAASKAKSLPLTTSEDFDALRPEWEALHARTRGGTIFNHPGWVSAWLRHFGSSCIPVFLAIRRDEELAGVAPMDMDPAATRLLGDHNVSDHGPLLAADGEEAFVARGILEWLNEDMAPYATAWGIPEASPLAAALDEMSGPFGWECETREEAVAPARELPASFEDYLALLPKKDRHELRRKLRNAEAAGDLTFDETTSPRGIATGFDRFLELMRESHTGKAAFLSPATEAFFREAATLSATLGCGRLSTLRLDAEPIAMTWTFENAEEVFLYNSGYATGHPGISPGAVSKARTIESAIARGKRRFNFLRGDEDYKRRMGGVPRRILSLVLRHR